MKLCKSGKKRELFGALLFPKLINPKGLLFQYENKKRDIHGTAEISIHVKPGEQRIIKVKAGSKLSVDVSPHFSASASIQEKRMELEKEGKIKKNKGSYSIRR